MDYSPLVFFLYYAKKENPHMMFGSHSIQEVWDILPGILNISVSSKELEKFLDDSQD